MNYDIEIFSEGLGEIIKFMNYFPENDQLRMNLLMGFVARAVMSEIIKKGINKVVLIIWTLNRVGGN